MTSINGPAKPTKQLPLETRLVEQKLGMLSRLWNGVKDAASHGAAQAGHFAAVRIVSKLDKNKDQVESELVRLRGELKQSTGTEYIAKLISTQNKEDFPWLLDKFRDKVRNQ